MGDAAGKVLATHSPAADPHVGEDQGDENNGENYVKHETPILGSLTGSCCSIVGFWSDVQHFRWVRNPRYGGNS
jgi:hypothetical protein